MSWEQQAYSFGNPNAQPPTPTQTPTSAAFPSPVFQTPRAQNHHFDNRSGWTPTFAEEYSVFNSTPGRLTSHTGTFPDISTPRPSTASSHKRPLSTAEELEVELASHVHHTVQTSLPLPPVDPARQLSSSPTFPFPRSGQSENKDTITPRKPRRRLEEAFSGQTATPPPSAAKNSRRLAPKAAVSMQGDQESYNGPTGTPGQTNIMHFSSHSEDVFTYPISAPATAPIFTNTKSFWDPDSSMGGMDMDFSVNDTMFDPSNAHRMNSSFDWGRSNQTFQDADNLSFSTEISQPSRRQRQLAAKPLSSSAETQTNSMQPSYDFSVSMSEDPFAMVVSTGAVDPGLLFSFPEVPPASKTTSDFGTDKLDQQRPASSHMVREPYQHQLRESRRDQEERRSRSSRENSISTRYNRNSHSSPVRLDNRPGIQRSVSESRPRRLGVQKIAPRPIVPEVKVAPNRGRSSPLKRQNRMSLTSIPESVSGMRTSVVFSIDEKGRARTETKIIVDDPRIVTRGASGSNSATSVVWDSDDPSDSSTDEEPIILPSHNPSFQLPPKGNGPKIAQFETSRPSIEGRRRRSSRNGTLSRSSQDTVDDPLSEAETIMDEDEGSGNAAIALRKVVESKKAYAKQRSSSQATPRNHQRYSKSASSTNLSPTTLSDPDLDTPSTDRGSFRTNSTRCVCNRRDDDTFMIQCESCEKWLHAKCVNVHRDRLPNVYICAFCAQTPNMRGGRIREPARAARGSVLESSPLAHKSLRSWR